MAHLDVYATPGAGRRGYVLDVQAGLLSGLRTRVVVPLQPAHEAPPGMRNLNPVFDVLGEPYVMVTQSLSSVPVKELGKPLMSGAAWRDDVLRALDVLIGGY
jgi:toxin CcdB